MSAYTKGPWTDVSDPRPNKNVAGHRVPMAMVSTHAGRACVDCTGSGNDYSADCANARLIAAAPELLAALKDAAHVINGMHNGTLPPCFKPTLELVNDINYTIAKATGAAS